MFINLPKMLLYVCLFIHALSLVIFVFYCNPRVFIKVRNFLKKRFNRTGVQDNDKWGSHYKQDKTITILNILIACIWIILLFLAILERAS